MLNDSKEEISMRNFQVLRDEKSGKFVKAWINGVVLEDEAKKQLMNAVNLPFIYKWLSAMPDVHVGIGATIGSVIPTQGAIIPAAVGVDIGCGMMAVLTSLVASDLPDSLLEMRLLIEAAVPHGRSHHGGPGDIGAWSEIPQAQQNAWALLEDEYKIIIEKHPHIDNFNNCKANTVNHLGTLGTGNHFIEVCLDEADRVWFMLHSGSRGVGGRIGDYFTRLAKADMKKWFINVPDVDLAYFPEGTDHFDDYVQAVGWAQRYAMINRELMMNAIIKTVSAIKGIPTFTANLKVVNCHHNYVDRERHFGKNVLVTRKGAIRARKDDLGIIPGSMGAQSYIVQGKGNRDSFKSCSHGAGRKMSRKKARKTFTVEDHIKATEGIECIKDESVLDETRDAYKDIDAVIEAQLDLITILHTLHQVVNVKGRKNQTK